MKHLHENIVKTERALCVGLSLKNGNKETDIDSINELQALAKSAGATVTDTIIQVRNSITPKYFIGKGMVEEIAINVDEDEIDTVIFDNELTGVQVRNLERELKCKVIGRTELILDIFAQRAKTKIAKLQVELAQLEFIRPRLRRAWTHLSRIQGGIGFRGPGETQLETDKRLIAKRITRIKNELKKAAKHIKNTHKRRKQKNLVALVGYTNAGKSTLLNTLSGERLYAKNMLFSTLDSTTRQVYLNSECTVLISDTVGFIRKLPHQLVESFRSTLSEVIEADLLLHVIDISRDDVETQIGSVNNVLDEIGLHDKKIIHVFNKADLLDNIVTKKRFSVYNNAVFISAKNEIGIQDLKNEIINFFKRNESSPEDLTDE
jgi:GTP-binding protein HflX